MNRKIIFRGKTIATGEWVFGDLEQRRATSRVFIHQYNDDGTYKGQAEVMPGTVGQFCNMQDHDGHDIYEGDMVVEMRPIDCPMEPCPHYHDEVKDGNDWWCDCNCNCPEVEDWEKIHVVDLDDFRFWLADETFGYEGEDMIRSKNTRIFGNVHDRCDWSEMSNSERTDFLGEVREEHIKPFED